MVCWPCSSETVDWMVDYSLVSISHCYICNINKSMILFFAAKTAAASVVLFLETSEAYYLFYSRLTTLFSLLGAPQLFHVFVLQPKVV